MNTAISKRARSVRPDTPQGKPVLRVLPILGPSRKLPSYRLLDGEALSAVRVTEISAGGSVPDLKVENTLDERVYLMDGQELVGAKQNRILNTDVLIPARSTVTIPVSCVEAHRWRYVSDHFTSGKSASYAVRARKQSRVHESLRVSQRHDAHQDAVWRDVDSSMRSSGTTSPTAAMHDAYVQREKDLLEFRDSMRIPDKAVGLAVFRGRRFLGLDLFDRHVTLVKFWQNLLDSYAIDWLFAVEVEDEVDAPGTTDERKLVTMILERAATGRWEKFASPGEGDDYRLDDKEYTGSSLVWRDRAAIHLQLFPRIGPGGRATD